VHRKRGGQKHKKAKTQNGKTIKTQKTKKGKKKIGKRRVSTCINGINGWSKDEELQR
jgi:hypothetical protein